MTTTDRKDLWKSDAHLNIPPRTRVPKRGETISTTTRSEMQRRDRVRVYNSADQTVASGGTLIVAWDSETFDEAGMHDPADNTKLNMYQADAAAFVWAVMTQISWEGGSPAGSFRIHIYKNGTTLIARSAFTLPAAGAAGGHVMSAHGMTDQVLPGDYFTVQVFQQTGGNLDVECIDPDKSFFQAVALW